jgi:ABC-type transporter Mla maintaining outer membrane lipid asymmetry ATPase subunit MlaF
VETPARRPADDRAPAGVALSLRGLRCEIAPGVTLDVPRLDLPRGLLTVMLGASAAGKSTLLRLLARVDEGYFPRARRLAGEAWLDPGGRPPLDLLALPRGRLAAQRVLGPVLAFVFQQEALFTFCGVLENVAWPLRELGVPAAEADARARALLVRVGLAPDRAVPTLSGGERKKLALARALAPDPAVLFLDEPFTGLDPVAQRALIDLVAAERGRRTAVIVTHERLPYDVLADHVVLMGGGRVLRAGPRAELDGVVRAFLDGQPLAATGPEGGEHG